ncbi:MAG: hypothetical protein JO142_10430 [Burkholderiales bacterium]|nr:hypothetical protein [Burkholderiales bacterium]
MYEDSGRSPAAVSRALGVTERNVYARLNRLEKVLGTTLRSRSGHAVAKVNRDTRPNPIDLRTGVIVVGSDAHYYPGEPTTAHRGMVRVCQLLGPDIVVMNGDEFDGATMSRHAPLGWETRPSIAEELEACRERMAEIKAASPGAVHLGSYGNHTVRIDNFLASHAAAAKGLPGTTFDDYFPGWTYAWAWIVNHHTLIKHRIRGGVHAAWNNTSDAQISTVTGHTHSLQVKPRTTMSPLNNGVIYGCDTGMLADPWGEQFTYMEAGPRQWRSGFAVLTFNNGILMPPELAQVVDDGLIFFRGNVIQV